VTLKKLNESQLMVYQLLRILGERASTMEIIGLAKKKHPDLPRVSTSIGQSPPTREKG